MKHFKRLFKGLFVIGTLITMFLGIGLVFMAPFYFLGFEVAVIVIIIGVMGVAAYSLGVDMEGPNES